MKTEDFAIAHPPLIAAVTGKLKKDTAKTNYVEKKKWLN